MEEKWIRIQREKGKTIPSFASPVRDGVSITKLNGTFRVRIEDGSVVDMQAVEAFVHAKNDDGSSESGTYIYFEMPFNGMKIIYNLDEVDVLLEEITAATSSPKRSKASKAA